MAKGTATSNRIISPPKYIPVINSLRGLASVTVCIFHLVCLPLNFLEHTLIFEIAPYGKLGVQVFFVITGVVIPIALIKGKYNYSLFSKFMLKRIVRIEPPYLFSILTAISFILLRNHFLAKAPHDIPTVKNLLLHLGYLIPFFKDQHWFIIVFWTMAVEFQFYLLISLLFPLLSNHNLIVRLISYITVFGAALIFTNGEFVPVWLPIFMIGIIYANFLFAKINLLEFSIVLMVSIGFGYFLHGVAITFISVCTLGIIHFFSNYQNKLGNFFGNISYSLYLTHTIFGSAIANFFVPHVSNLYEKLLVVLLSFMVSVLSAYVFYLLIEKPSQKYASKIPLKTKPKEVDALEELTEKEFMVRSSLG
ncbi:acyltransferase family protein [Mucilaginibacter arboris]|uniref:Acyltransferase family protein n=1 Tax=Mucilaginibacter arboris TaxID=2682090 RepID=A0A7K1SSC5_9SPHI|nr:acyltransferase [Mucilaginibacter arboris]MVN20213.1 acyltransferase family protein [Mucilaginibacter arboris]